MTMVPLQQRVGMRAAIFGHRRCGNQTPARFAPIVKWLLPGCAVAGLLLGAPLAAAAPGQSVTVTLANMSFGRVPTNLKVGDTVVWVNRDTVPHTVTARDHSFDYHLAPGQSASQTLGKPGTFPFYCLYHSTMRGTLQVRPAS